MNGRQTIAIDAAKQVFYLHGGDNTDSIRRLLVRLFNVCLTFHIATFAFTSLAFAQGQSNEKQTLKTEQRTNAEQRETWRRSMVKVPRPKKGCFEAHYPETQWREVPCVEPPPFRLSPGVGGGVLNDFVSQSSDPVSTAEGSFDSVVVGVTNSGSSGLPDPFSLQINTNTFLTGMCSGAVFPSACRGWQQFAYQNSGFLFIEYWLINFRAKCPTGWNTYINDCWINGIGAAKTPIYTFNELGDLKLTATAADDKEDTVMLSTGSVIYSASGDNRFPELAQNWNETEFNVFGDCCLHQAQFNSGSTIVVRVITNASAPTSVPNCLRSSFTGETNNLTLVGTPASEGGELPSIVFTESNAASPTPPSCATGGPQVLGISPASGPNTGGTSVTISGFGFDSASAPVEITFGEIPGIAPICTSINQCTVMTPQYISGTNGADQVVSVQVKSNGVLSASPQEARANGTNVPTFTYLAGPFCLQQLSCNGIPNGEPNVLLSCPGKTNFYIGGLTNSPNPSNSASFIARAQNVAGAQVIACVGQTPALIAGTFTGGYCSPYSLEASPNYCGVVPPQAPDFCAQCVNTGGICKGPIGKKTCVHE